MGLSKDFSDLQKQLRDKVFQPLHNHGIYNFAVEAYKHLVRDLNLPSSDHLQNAYLLHFMNLFSTMSYVASPENIEHMMQGKGLIQTKVINEFVVHIGRKLPGVAIERIDERFTSKLAKQAISMSGLGKKKRESKGLVDAISATIILQSYLQQKK